MVLKDSRGIPSTSKLFSFHPLLDNQGLMRVGGRLIQANLHYWKQHPVILPSDQEVTKLIIQSKHLQLLHTGPTLVASSLLSPLLYNQRVKDDTPYHPQLHHLLMRCIQAMPPNHGAVSPRQTEPRSTLQLRWRGLLWTDNDKVWLH